jgi:hypothetical protein
VELKRELKCLKKCCREQYLERGGWKGQALLFSSLNIVQIMESSKGGGGHMKKKENIEKRDGLRGGERKGMDERMLNVP